MLRREALRVAIAAEVASNTPGPAHRSGWSPRQSRIADDNLQSDPAGEAGRPSLDSGRTRLRAQTAAVPGRRASPRHSASRCSPGRRRANPGLPRPSPGPPPGGGARSASPPTPIVLRRVRRPRRAARSRGDARIGVAEARFPALAIGDIGTCFLARRPVPRNHGCFSPASAEMFGAAVWLAVARRGGDGRRARLLRRRCGPPPRMSRKLLGAFGARARRNSRSPLEAAGNTAILARINIDPASTISAAVEAERKAGSRVTARKPGRRSVALVSSTHWAALDLMPLDIGTADERRDDPHDDATSKIVDRDFSARGGESPVQEAALPWRIVCCSDSYIAVPMLCRNGEGVLRPRRRAATHTQMSTSGDGQYPAANEARSDPRNRALNRSSSTIMTASSGSVQGWIRRACRFARPGRPAVGQPGAGPHARRRRRRRAKSSRTEEVLGLGRGSVAHRAGPHDPRESGRGRRNPSARAGPQAGASVYSRTPLPRRPSIAVTERGAVATIDPGQRSRLAVGADPVPSPRSAAWS